MTADQLSAREQIRELVASYTHLGDGGRLDDLLALFDAEGWLEAVDPTGSRRRYVGPTEVAGFFTGIVSGREAKPTITFVRHHISNVTISLDGPDVASGVFYWAVYSDHGFESSGRYRDAYRRGADGRWRFASRTIRRDEPRGAKPTSTGVDLTAATA